jgi:putative ABC transport system permease protein
VGFIRTPIVQAQRRVGRSHAPLWARLYLDLAALVLAVVVYEITQQNGGFKPVLNAEGNPTVSLSIFTFVAPLLFWAGSILFLVRISRWVVRHSGRVLDPLFRRILGVVGELASRTLERRSGSLHQVVVLLAMGVAFGISLLTFVHTYDQQQRVDAELTLGSDVKVGVVNRAQSPTVARNLMVPGVRTFTPFRSTIAYVGSEIQDIFGIDVSTFVHATRLANSFFVGNSAAGTLQRLQATPNGILVSDETARDFSLVPGDSLVLRMLDARTHRYVPIHFRLVGVAKEFATAPKDAFLVANLAYIQRATNDHGVDTFLIQTAGPPGPVTQSLRAQFANGPLVHVDDLTHVQQQLATSLSSLNLSSLTTIDLLYTGIMVVVCLLVFSLAVLLERRRDFAMLQAMGTTSLQIQLLLLAELGYAMVIGSIFGLIVGIGFSELLVQILTAIFDPPPQSLAVPWLSVAGLLGLVLVGGVLASALAAARLRQLNLAQTLRDVA